MKWNISAKVKLIFSIVLFFLLFLGSIAYLNIRRFENNTEWADHSHQVILALQKLYATLKDTQTNYDDFLLTHKTNYAKACQSDMKDMNDGLSHADELISNDPIFRKNMDHLQSLIQKKIASIQTGLNNAESGRSDLAIHNIQNGDEKRENSDIKDLVNQMTGMQIWLLKTRKIFEETSAQKNVQFTLGSTLCALIICGLAGYLMNRQIEERQATLNHLRSSEEKFRFLAETANDSFITSNAQGVISDVNPAGETMFGYSKAELLGKPLTLLMPQKFTEEHGAQAFEKFVSMTIGIKTVELYGRKKDGTEFPLELSVSKWEARDGIFYTTIIRDITERKFFIKTLLNNEHRLFQFLDAVPVAVFVRDPAGNPYYANRMASEIFGVETFKGQVDASDISKSRKFYLAGTDQLYPNDQLPIVKALAGEKSHVDNIEMRLFDQRLFLESWGTPILNENGEIKYALSSLIDVTRQKQITESLKEREEFFRNLFEEGPIGMALTFSDGIFVNVNRAFLDMLGYSKSDVIGRPFFDFIDPADVPMERSLNEKLFEKLIPKYQVEKRYITQKGNILWCKVSASIIRDLNNEPLFRLAIVENITDQKEAETALKESEERFRAVTDSANESIVSADSYGRIIYFNPAAVRLFGYEAKEIQGKPLTSLLSEKSYAGQAEEFRRAFAGGTSKLVGRNTEWVGLNKEGREFPLELSLYTWFTDAGIFVTAILRDITERKQVEEMKNDLISVVSHQLKTPVAEINGYIENMMEGLAGTLSEKQKHYLIDMKEIGMENYRLISDLLNMSKIERGVMTVDLKPVPLRQIVELAVRDYEATIAKKGLRFEVHNSVAGLYVLADRDKVVETVRNVINNAIKCTDRGTITIKVRSEDLFGIIEISDSGIGMSDMTLKKLFTKSRVMGAEAARAGAGLGLYIAKSFMNLQNGDITVESKLGKGSTFCIKIPITNKEPE